jgi:hypothetical protein
MSELETSFDLSPNIRALFLLFLAISGNFLGNTLNCSIQKVLTENSIMRHMFIILMIYFTIDYSSKSSMNPLEILKSTLIIYILFILLTKQTHIMFIINFVLIFIIYILFIQSQYVKGIEDDREILFDEEYVLMISSYLQKILYVTLIIGFGLYFNKQYIDHRKDFDITKFFFGLNRCSSL